MWTLATQWWPAPAWEAERPAAGRPGRFFPSARRLPLVASLRIAPADPLADEASDVQLDVLHGIHQARVGARSAEWDSARAERSVACGWRKRGRLRWQGLRRGLRLRNRLRLGRFGLRHGLWLRGARSGTGRAGRRNRARDAHPVIPQFRREPWLKRNDPPLNAVHDKASSARALKLHDDSSFGHDHSRARPGRACKPHAVCDEYASAPGSPGLCVESPLAMPSAGCCESA